VPDLQITTLETLKQYLHVALQIEHATLPPYLTALYSIRPGSNSDAVDVLRVVAVEEMLHLALTANLLNAVGGQPDLIGPDFVPHYPAFLPDGERDFEVHLQSFSPDAIYTFRKIERPQMAPDPNSRLLARRDRPGRSLLAACPNNAEMHYYSIGEFYNEIEQGVVNLEEQARAEGRTIFVGGPGRQINSEHYYSGGGKLFCVTDIVSAHNALDLIIAQGEGQDRGVYGREGELAHYYRFDQLLRGRYYRKYSEKRDVPDVPTGDELKVDWCAVYPIKMDAKLADYQPESDLHAAAVAFNNFYAQFLRLLNRAFNGEPALLQEAVPKMFDIRNLANQLMRNPLCDGLAINAAPTFEVGVTGE
jgi:hypothetical protein